MKVISKELDNSEISEKLNELNLDNLNLKNLNDTYYSVLVLGNTCNGKTKNLELKSQLEGTLNRIKTEKKYIESSLNKVGLQSDNFNEKFNNGNLIYHKFRGANNFGGTVINEMIFILNDDKSKVENSINLDQ